MATMQLPTGAWNCHLHCFTPERFPFKETRAYTPMPAPLSALVDNSLVNKVMVVQASIEDGPSGLLDTLEHGRRKHRDKVFRGTIAADPTATTTGLESFSISDFDRCHEAGVRSIRIHGSYGGCGDDSAWVRDQIRRTAQLYPVKKYGWTISAQLPLKTWSSLVDHLLSDPDLSNLQIIADHNGCVSPHDVGSPELARFLRLLDSGRVHVKLGAFHRRSPDNINRMKEVVQLFAQRAPASIIWGSDWPHIDASNKGPIPGPPLQGVDTLRELAALRDWLSDEQWYDMLVSNPERIFGH